jgi:hypothetical protein
MKLFLLAAVALCALVGSEAKCTGTFVGGSISTCEVSPKWVKAGGGKLKDWTSSLCLTSDVSNQECVKLATTETWIAGRSMGPYTCNVYARDDCLGPYVSVDKDGWFEFPRGAVLSFRCPCRKP